MARPEKVAVVEEIAEKLSKSQLAVLTDYRGLNVKDITELRKKLREAGVEYKVVKNTLTTLAARKLELTDLEPHLVGPTAVAFGYDDPVAPAKILSDFAQEHKELELKVGVLEGKVIDAEALNDLAKLPNREVLLAMLLGAMQGPIGGFARVLAGPITGFVRVLDQIREQKEQA
ncbi:MAG: 50S ribosomal protein L10 [Firmicutes bacterium]|jgi:large subunit ribosomal protein L10|nr:50S ribosomal protein L10 [Bacillota bacterium]HOB21478.1 50S ribosomal protein L10 [Bacillota bacterium]HQD39189.1 50S ribosomal protein L10 [Bacillota bacterium]